MVWPIFDLYTVLSQLTMDHGLIDLTASCKPTALFSQVRMLQGAAGAPSWLVSAMPIGTDDLSSIRMHLYDAIGFDNTPLAHFAKLASFFARLRLHRLKLSTPNSGIGATSVESLGHTISPNGLRPHKDTVYALLDMPMPEDMKQRRSLVGGLRYYLKFNPKMAKRMRARPWPS